MSTEDISRFLFQPRRHYSGARLQQGRALVDSDFNEEAKTDDEDLRRILADVIGSAGSPNGGFTPELTRGQTVVAVPVLFGGAVPVFVLNFNLRPGSILLGGMRFELEASEPVVFQKDFLQMSPGDAPLAELGTRNHLVFLRGWEQPVTAVEDEEILEGAMSGADSTSRVRRMRRVETRRVDATEPAPAFDEVIADLTQDGSATFDEATSELRSNARMHIEFLTTNEPSQCPPCDRSQEGQYLGSENNTYRIMLATGSSYVWAFDDGAPLYRVKVFLTGADARVEMLTPPKDSIHFPTENAVVEFLPWSALLDNGEKAANMVGFFGEVMTPYSAGDRSFTVRLAPESLLELGFIARKVAPAQAKNKAKLKVKTGGADRIHTISVRWDPHHPQAADLNPSGDDAEGFVAFVYMRIWHQRAAGDPFLVPTSSGLPLARTGLVPRFSGLGRPGDYWVVAARPSAPTEVIPLELLRPEGVPPHGPREFLTPLSLVEWEALNPFIHRVKSLRDARSPFAPVTEGDCCTIVVSQDGGGFSTIQAAIDALPASGGRICVQPGVYQEEVFLDHRTNVVIEGCGPETIIETPASPTGDSLVQIIGPDLSDASIELRRLTLRSHGQTGILATGEKITLRELDITTDAGSAPETLPAIAILDGRDVKIFRNEITMDLTASSHAAVYVESPILGTFIEQNRIITRHDPADDSSLAWGGVHIAGNSRQVEIRRNLIVGGLGNGITLGSVIFRATDGTQILERRRQGAGKTQIDTTTTPPTVTGEITSFPEGTNEFFPQFEGPLDDILIEENLIVGSGNNGIAVIAIVLEHDDEPDGPPLCLPGEPETFQISRLAILDNLIDGNLLNPPEEVILPNVVGGIILSEANELTIRANRIEGNGFGSDGPVCGIYVGQGSNLLIDSNELRINGSSPSTPASVGDLRGGIVVIPTNFGGTFDDASFIAKRVFIWGNTVEQNEGPALLMLVHGQCSVLGNHFSTKGRNVPSILGEFGPTSVLVFDVGAPWESVSLRSGEPDINRWDMPESAPGFIQEAATSFPVGNGGAVAFNDNVVVSSFEQGPERSLGVLLFSFDSVNVKGNQLELRAKNDPVIDHTAIVGFTVCGAKNRFAESVDGSTASAVISGFALAAGVHNVSTHCLFVEANDTDSKHFADQGNLRLLTPTGPDECGEPPDILGGIG